jgi:hypothetical protein
MAEILPTYLTLSSISNQAQPNVNKNQFDDGFSKTMYNNTLMREVYSLTYFVCSIDELNSFKLWHRKNLKQGLMSFSWKNCLTGDYNLVKIIDGSINIKPVSNNLDLSYEISFNIERFW